MKLIAILLTVHNRKAKTLQCLNKLFTQQGIDEYQFDVYLTDDACTDGTPELVSAQFPSVFILKGDGNLFWNRGMYFAWQQAAQTKRYDFYLWLNDDTALNSNALAALISTSHQFQHKSIVVGTTCAAKAPFYITYGGRNVSGQLINPTSVPKICKYFNGNLVLIPKVVYDKLGMNDPIFRHALGDFDYGLRANKIGIISYVAPGILGICDLHEQLPIWCNPSIPLRKRWKAFRKPLGHNPEEFFIYEKRHSGYAKALFHYFTNHFRVLFPSFWKY